MLLVIASREDRSANELVVLWNAWRATFSHVRIFAITVGDSILVILIGVGWWPVAPSFRCPRSLGC